MGPRTDQRHCSKEVNSNNPSSTTAPITLPTRSNASTASRAAQSREHYGSTELDSSDYSLRAQLRGDLRQRMPQIDDLALIVEFCSRLPKIRIASDKPPRSPLGGNKATEAL